MDQDRDPAETREWLDALDSVEAFEGIDRIDELLNRIVQAARRKGAKLPFAANSAYVNTIAPHEEPVHPGDRVIEHKIRSLTVGSPLRAKDTWLRPRCSHRHL